MPPAGESWSSAFRVIHPRSDGGAKPVANTSPAAGGLIEASAASQATPSHVGVQSLLADGLHVNSAFSRVLQPAPQPVPHSQPSNPPLSRLQPLRGPLPPPPAAKTNKRPRCVDKKNECQEDVSGVVSTTSGRGGPAPEVGIDGVGGEKAPKRARRRLEDHAARMQQHFLSLVDAISSHSLEPPETKGAGRGSSSKARFKEEVVGGSSSTQKAVRKPRLRASQLRKRD
ncbi:uncharacterized protein LOC134780132 [Penaeus indicus]|uniref:uncharacterized protein LOC134780132 n=1 Tax=Penaeus indicus TaxID=29960 RepID=UPI00300D75FB